MKKFNTVKKVLAVLAASVLPLSLASCGGKPESKSNPDALKVGVVQMADNGAFTDMREGFVSRMRELGYAEDKMEFTYKNAQGDMSTLNTICQDMATGDMDFIVSIATPATQAMVNQGSEKPVFYIAVADPILAGVVTDMAKPDKNATGVSNSIPVKEMMELSDKLTPGVETFGIIYNTGEVNAVKTADTVKAYLTENGKAFKEAVVTASSEVQQAAQTLADSVDALFIPNDSMVQSAMPQVAEVAKEAKIPVYGSSAVMVQSGALVTVSINDPALGAMTADMADQYLKGKKIEEIPAVYSTDFTTVINKTTAAAIGLEIPKDIADSATIVE